MDKNNVDTAKELPTVISFCSGYGGIERGLDLAGVEHRVLAYVEIEAFAIANLVAKMETGQLVPAPIFTDLKTFPAHLFRGCVDIITGGYPCQPFSAAGKRLGTEDPRHLWPYILDHIKAIRPVRCMFENVEGHISLGLREVIGDLEGAGYSPAWGIFSAAEVDAPYQRKRVYILANANNARQQPSGWAIPEFEVRDNTRRGCKELADTISQRLEGQPRHGSDSSEPRWQSPQEKRSTCQSSLLSNTTGWAPEPGLGRVVDGCPNRVDRLRLLGNGVVPQTAARAWGILSSRFE